MENMFFNEIDKDCMLAMGYEDFCKMKEVFDRQAALFSEMEAVKKQQEIAKQYKVMCATLDTITRLGGDANEMIGKYLMEHSIEEQTAEPEIMDKEVEAPSVPTETTSQPSLDSIEEHAAEPIIMEKEIEDPSVPIETTRQPSLDELMGVPDLLHADFEDWYDEADDVDYKNEEEYLLAKKREGMFPKLDYLLSDKPIGGVYGLGNMKPDGTAYSQNTRVVYAFGAGGTETTTAHPNVYIPFQTPVEDGNAA